MELTKKIKLALDETRILILGAQILLGFQFRAVFSDRYEELSASLQCLDGVALLPMICVVALLIHLALITGSYRMVRTAGLSTV